MYSDQVRCSGQVERLSHCCRVAHTQSVASPRAVVAMCPCHTFNISNNTACLLTLAAGQQGTHLSRQRNQLLG